MSTSEAFTMNLDDEDDENLLHHQGQKNTEKISKLNPVNILRGNKTVIGYGDRKDALEDGKSKNADVHHSNKEHENYRAYNQAIDARDREYIRLLEEQREDYKNKNNIYARALEIVDQDVQKDQNAQQALVLRRQDVQQDQNAQQALARYPNVKE